MKENGKVIVSIREIGPKEPPKRLLSYRETEGEKELKIEIRLGYGRTSAIDESSNKQFDNILEGYEIECVGLEKGREVEVYNTRTSNRELCKEVDKIRKKIQKGTVKKSILEYIEKKEGKEYKTEIEGVTYALRTEVVRHKEEYISVNILELKIEEVKMKRVV